MTWLDIITPISKTLIPDDERRQGVNRGFLTAAVLILVFLFIYWLFKDLAVVPDAQDHLNQVTKAINAIKYRFKLSLEGEEEYRQAVYMTGYTAEKLSWRSKDVHEVAMKILCEYLPDDEEE